MRMMRNFQISSRRGVDKALLGASHYNLIAENSGELFLKIQMEELLIMLPDLFRMGGFFFFPDL